MYVSAGNGWENSPFEGVEYNVYDLGFNKSVLRSVAQGESMPAHRHPVTERSWLISGTWEALNQTQYSPSNGVPVYFEIPPGERHGGTAITECKFIDLMPESLVWIEDNGTVRYMEPDGDFVTLGNPGTADLDL